MRPPPSADSRLPPGLRLYRQSPPTPARTRHPLSGGAAARLSHRLPSTRTGGPAFVPSDGTLAKVSDGLIRERPVDLALLCVGNWNLVKHRDAVTIVRNLRPQNVLLGHWEDFFKDQSTPASPAPLQLVWEYHKLVEREPESLRCPAKVRLPRHGAEGLHAAGQLVRAWVNRLAPSIVKSHHRLGHPRFGTISTAAGCSPPRGCRWQSPTSLGRCRSDGHFGLRDPLAACGAPDG